MDEQSSTATALRLNEVETDALTILAKGMTDTAKTHYNLGGLVNQLVLRHAALITAIISVMGTLYFSLFSLMLQYVSFEIIVVQIDLLLVSGITNLIVFCLLGIIFLRRLIKK